MCEQIGKQWQQKKLFRTPEEILSGYEELNVKDRRKVYLRGRVLTSGKVSLFLYSCFDGKVERKEIIDPVSNERVKNILVPELTLALKNENEETLKLASMAANRINDNLERGILGLPERVKSKILLTEYIDGMIEKAKENGQKSRRYGLQSLRKHIERCEPSVKLSTADAKFVRKFLIYIENEATDVHYKHKTQKQLTENTRWTLCRNLKMVFTTAIREKLRTTNPFAELERGEVPHVQLDRRDYLEVEEVKRLMETPCKSDAIRRAFLFCCFVGVRYGDARKLTWKEIARDENGLYMKTEQQKTGDPLRAYISDVAASFLPPRKGDGIVFELPNNTYCNKILKIWAKDAKIKKNVTYHMSRHTSATMLLNLDTPIEVVAKQLGHKRTATTEIYAKIIGKTQSSAVSKQDELFNMVEG